LTNNIRLNLHTVCILPFKYYGQIDVRLANKRQNC